MRPNSSIVLVAALLLFGTSSSGYASESPSPKKPAHSKLCAQAWSTYDQLLDEQKERVANDYPGVLYVEQDSSKPLLTIALTDPYNGPNSVNIHVNYPVQEQLFVRTTTTPTLPVTSGDHVDIFAMGADPKDSRNKQGNSFAIATTKIAERLQYVHVQYRLGSGEGHYYFRIDGPLCEGSNSKSAEDAIAGTKFVSSECGEFRKLGFRGETVENIISFRVYKSTIKKPLCAHPA